LAAYDLSFSIARFASRGINLAARLYRLLHFREARSLAGGAHMFFELWRLDP
jgi:hypothetical protein